MTAMPTLNTKLGGHARNRTEFSRRRVLSSKLHALKVKSCCPSLARLAQLLFVRISNTSQILSDGNSEVFYILSFPR